MSEKVKKTRKTKAGNNVKPKVTPDQLENPKSRVEAYLHVLANNPKNIAGLNLQNIPSPKSRVEWLLRYLCEQGVGGGGGAINPQTLIDVNLQGNKLVFNRQGEPAKEIDLKQILKADNIFFDNATADLGQGIDTVQAAIEILAEYAKDAANTHVVPNNQGLITLAGLKTGDVVHVVDSNGVQDYTGTVVGVANKPMTLIYDNGATGNKLRVVSTKWNHLKDVSEYPKRNIFNKNEVLDGQWVGAGGTSIGSNPNWRCAKIPCTPGGTLTIIKDNARANDSQNHAVFSDTNAYLGVITDGGRNVAGVGRVYKININANTYPNASYIVVNMNKEPNKDYTVDPSKVMVFNENIPDADLPREYVHHSKENQVVFIDGDKVSLSFNKKDTTLKSTTVQDAIIELNGKIAQQGGGTVTSVNGQPPAAGGGNVVLNAEHIPYAANINGVNVTHTKGALDQLNTKFDNYVPITDTTTTGTGVDNANKVVRLDGGKINANMLPNIPIGVEKVEYDGDKILTVTTNGQAQQHNLEALVGIKTINSNAGQDGNFNINTHEEIDRAGAEAKLGNYKNGDTVKITDNGKTYLCVKDTEQNFDTKFIILDKDVVAGNNGVTDINYEKATHELVLVGGDNDAKRIKLEDLVSKLIQNK